MAPCVRPAASRCWRRLPPPPSPCVPAAPCPWALTRTFAGDVPGAGSGRLGFDGALALGPYEGTIRDLCLLLKHERNAWLARWLSELLAEARQADLLRLPRDAWIVPVPLHWWRRLRRGYNQAEALAQGLSRRIDLRVHQALRRVKAADHLAYKDATGRMQAMRGAFRSRRHHDLKGRTILLVDDILTTGATTGAAARALKQAGARRVVVAVLARTV